MITKTRKHSTERNEMHHTNLYETRNEPSVHNQHPVNCKIRFPWSYISTSSKGGSVKETAIFSGCYGFKYLKSKNTSNAVMRMKTFYEMGGYRALGGLTIWGIYLYINLKGCLIIGFTVQEAILTHLAASALPSRRITADNVVILIGLSAPFLFFPFFFHCLSLKFLFPSMLLLFMNLCS